MTFALTAKQHEANELLAGPYLHTLLYGGSRSGKTLLILRAMVLRCLKAPGSRHLAVRFRFNACVTKLALDTFPKMMAMCFPEIPARINQEFWYWRSPNDSELWFGGLDDKQRAEKVLGGEYATVFLNECSEIPYVSRGIVLTRLAQAARRPDGRILPLRAWYDENPPNKAHWSYRLFQQKVDPDTKRALNDASLYASMQLNPHDNEINLAPEYIRNVLQGQSARLQRRFLHGEFGEIAAGALFSDEHLDKWRVLDGNLPDFQRIVVAVDPSGSGDADNTDNDAIGIVVAALGTDGNGYLLEDLTLKAGPATWGRVATAAFERHGADRIVAEANYGGAMVQHVIQTARPRTPVTLVNATRGKVVRAEPVSALVEQGKVRLVGYFPELEEELAGATTNGYVGDGSPNRMDAFVWAFAALFPGIVAGAKVEQPEAPIVLGWSERDGLESSQSWLGV